MLLRTIWSMKFVQQGQTLVGLCEYKGPEQVGFDVMAESLDKKYVLVGECKWTDQGNGEQLGNGHRSMKI